MGVTMAFDPDVELIVGAYESQDDIGKILRSHLVIERQMELLVTSCSRAKFDRWVSFSSKVNLLRAMKAPEKVCVACESLNDLRNKFAHNSKATIQNTKSVSERYLVAVEAVAPVLPKLHGTFTRTKSGVRHEFTFANATHSQRIVLATSLLSAIIGGLPKMFAFGGPTLVLKVSGLSL